MEKEENKMVMQFIRLKSKLSEAELMKVAQERMPQFRAIPGLVQKYYVKMGEGNAYGGVYIWDSMESLQAYRGSELAASIPKAYQLAEPPGIEVMEILEVLRD